MVVSTVFGLIVAVVDVGALYWLAVPLPWLWGLLSYITNFQVLPVADFDSAQ